MIKFFQAFLFLFFCSVIFAQSYIDYKSPYHPTKTDKGIVVSQNIFSSEIGIDILNKGGNAVDAAVAVGFSLAITLPRAGNLGGGGFMLVYIKEKNEIFFIDYRSSSPLNANIQDLLSQDLPIDFSKINYKKTKDGYMAPGIPGTVSGLLTAHKNFGKLPLSEILKPVITQAKNGIRVTDDLNFAISNAPQLKLDKESLNLYFIDNKALPINSLFKREDLAFVLQEISDKGKKGFYEGKVAEKIAVAMKQNGGFISIDDLRNYQSFVSEPIAVNYRDNIVFAAGPPSGGGITLLTSLSVLQNFNMKKYGKNSAATYHLLAESLRAGHNNRSHHVGDPRFYDVPINDLLSKKRIKELSSEINFKSAVPSKNIKPLEIRNESRDTTHYSIVDSEGNAVSNTYTLGSSFGSGVTIPGTGILLNNQMRNFAYRYGDKTVDGRAASPGNKFHPGKRPMSTMSPVMVFDKKGNLRLITGSPGGSYIPAAILRVVTGVIDFDLDIGEASMLPRVHKDWPYKGLDYETTINSDSLKILEKLKHELFENKTIGSTQSIHIKNGIKYGYADLRRPNAGVAIQE